MYHVCLETIVIDSVRLGSALLIFMPPEESFSNSSVNKGHLRILLKLRFWFNGSDVGSRCPVSQQVSRCYRCR